MNKRAAVRRLYRLWLKEEPGMPFAEFVNVCKDLERELAKNVQSKTA